MIDLFKHILQKISLTILLKTGFFSFLSTASPSISSSLSRSSAGCCPGFRSVLASIWFGFFSSNAAEKNTKNEKHTIWVVRFHEKKTNSKNSLNFLNVMQILFVIASCLFSQKIWLVENSWKFLLPLVVSCQMQKIVEKTVKADDGAPESREKLK